MLNLQHPILNSVDPFIEPLVKRVLQAEKLGVCCGVIELDSVSSSGEKARGDRIKLSIPYAKQNLIWNIFFDTQCPELGPDFIFNDDTFLANPNVDTLSVQVPSLAKWDPTDTDSLFNVLMELLHCYKQHQIELLAKQSDRLQLEYSTLVGETDINAGDVEMILLPLGAKALEARFLISLSIDFSLLPTHMHHTESDTAMLIVTFYGPDWNRIIPQLYLSKFLEKAFGGASSLHIPPFPPDKYLMDYVPEVKKFIMEKINSLVQNYEKKKDFIATLLLVQRGAIVEYDAVDFSYIVILLEHRDFCFLVKFHLTLSFPKEKPIITLVSIYHVTPQGDMYSEVLYDIPYNRKWKSKYMIAKLLSYIIETAVPRFQTNSLKNICF